VLSPNGRPAEGIFAVIGCGSIGKRHLRNLRTLGVRAIVAFDTQAARRDEAARLGVETCDGLDAMWQMRPAVCVIATPTSSHLALALEAARRGCHLFVEKPLSHDWNDVERLLGSVKRRALLTLVGCNMRFHPGLRCVRTLLQERAVGRVVGARVEVGQYLPDWHAAEDYRASYSARRDLGGGVILDAIHELDYIRWLLGEVARVTCVTGKLSGLEIETEDTAALVLCFDKGAIGEVHLDYVQRAYRRTCQVIGDQGTIHWDYSAGEVRWYAARTRRWQVFSNPSGWVPNCMYIDEMKHFLRCLAGAEEPELGVLEAAKVLRIALAAKESACQQRWIDLGKPSWNANATL
jgi:predicted dehydrogenase